MNEPPDQLDVEQLVGQEVVLDLSSPFVYLGRLVGLTAGYVILADVDVHDLRDTSTTREKYVLESRQHGIHANRRQAWVSLYQIVGISRLEDVIAD